MTISPDLCESFVLNGYTYVIPINVVVEIERLRAALEKAAVRFEFITIGSDIAQAETGAREARVAIKLNPEASD